MLHLVGHEEERLLSYLYHLDEASGFGSDPGGTSCGLEVADYTFTAELGD